ncbi:MAG: HigA family addiction module antidote protein [Dysgonamonadaceae bacterium]|jgi:addiction module HigA family antidote|nr:HigA family addiction module antidote protein [Dysgonamonadaceae bacterium]
MGNLGYGFCPTHPGEILKDEIEYRGISQKKLAKQMEMSYSVVNEILNGRRPLTESNAILFEAALGVEADTLMRLQMKYNMQVLRKDEKLINRFNNIRKATAIF